ncbi:MAG TPA: tetratricopeptide repeat protein [Gemmatimonadaceae bacterium]|nr:tetratricopeptide repeat protein [Gemmatimonadaceae bacterium]
MTPASSGALAALNGVRPVLSHFDNPRSAEDLAADIIDLWTGVESSLRALVGGSALSGQALIRAARQSELITIEQAHALLEFLAARDRSNRTTYTPTQADGEAAVEGFKALESALSSSPAPPTTPSSPLQAAYTPRQQQQQVSPYAPPPAGGHRPPPKIGSKATSAGPPTIEQPPPPYLAGGVGPRNVEHALAAAETGGRKWKKIPKAAYIAVPVILVLLVGGYFLLNRTSTDALAAGVEAMQAGQRERARGEFAKAARDNPELATPHVFLARLAREEGDLAAARAQLDTALRLEPGNAVALREMGLVLFASRQYDLARRFFHRAVQANTEDKAAQGYLGCAMMRLNRVDEGNRWINRAGSGPWTACLQPVTATPPPL